VDQDGTAARAGTGRAGSTAPIPVTTAAQASASTRSGAVSVPSAGARPASSGAAPAGSASAGSVPGGSVPSSSPDPRTAPPVAPVPAPAQAAASRPVGPRRARLLVSRLDPWSVMKTSFMLSVSIGIVLLMSAALLWWTLDVTGVFAAIGRTIDDVAGSGTSSFDFLSLVSFSRVMGIALVLTAIEIVLGSALATLFAFLYNLSVGLTGGLEVTLSEDS
jgi:hypothetical protein